MEKKGNMIRNSKQLIALLKEGKRIFFQREGEIGIVFDADTYGQYAFVDVMNNIEKCFLYEVKEG